MLPAETAYWIDPVNGLDSPAGRYWYTGVRPYEADIAVDAVTYQNTDQALRFSTWATPNYNYLVTLRYRNISNEAYREIQNCILLAQGSLRSFYLDVNLFLPQGSGFTNFTNDIEFVCNETYTANKTYHQDIILSSPTATGMLKKGDILVSQELFGYTIINFVQQDTEIAVTNSPYLIPVTRSFRPLYNAVTPYTVKLARYIPVSLVENSFEATRSQIRYWNCEIQFVVRDTSL